MRSGSSPTASPSMSARSSATRACGIGALKVSAAIFRDLAERGIQLAMINLGGGFPTRYLKDVPAIRTYGQTIFRALRRHFGNRIPETIIEPGRGMVGNAGIIEAEVVLISKKSERGQERWVYLDIGKFNGLAETQDEMIRYPIRTEYDDDPLGPCVIAGPKLRLGRRAVREGALSPAGLARDRRQSPDRGNGRLHDDLFLGRLQRLSAAQVVCDLRVLRAGRVGAIGTSVPPLAVVRAGPPVPLVVVRFTTEARRGHEC